MKRYSLILFLSLFAVCNAQVNIKDGQKLYNSYLTAQKMGDFLGAETYLNSILEDPEGLSQYHISLVQNNLGLVNWNLGNYQEASEYYHKSLENCTGEDAASKKLKPLIYNNLGLLATQSGAFSSALEYFEKAENEIAGFTLKEERWYYDHLSMIELNKALVFIDIQKYPEAISLLHQSLQAKILFDLPYQGSVYFNLARSYKLQYKQDLSDLYFLKSISQWVEEYGEDHFELANVYLVYGQFLAEQENTPGAALYFQKAIDNYLTNYGPKHPYTAGCYKIISDVKYAQQNYKESLDFAQKALISICPGFESEDIFTNPLALESTLDLELLKIYRSKIQSLTALAEETASVNVQEQIKTLSLALETSEEAVKVLGRIQGSYLSQESRLFLTQNQKDIFILGIEIALKLYALTGMALYNEKAYGFAALGKTLEFNFEKRQKEKLYLNSLQDSTAKELISLRKNIEGYSHMIEHEQTQAKPDTSRLNQWKQARFALRREYESLHETVFGPEAKLQAIEKPFSSDMLRALQGGIKRNECLVEYAISGLDENGGGKLFAFVIDKKELFIYSTRTDTSFYKDIEMVHMHLNGFNPYDAGAGNWRELQASLTRLSDILISPLESRIPGKKLIIIPDDELSTIPFDALIINSSAPKQNAGINYLIKNHEVSLVPNSFMLDNKRAIRSKRPQIKVFSQDYARPVEGGLDYLALVAEERDAILKTIKGNSIPTSLPKNDILMEIKEADLIHFALHLFPSDQHQSSSYMVLHQDQDSAFSNLLFDYEIDPLELSTPLVVMNACESGSGQFHRGEGMLSLSRSFLLAGSKSVISTLWPVDDKAGSSIMIDFYEKLARGNSKSKALRKAKLSYLEESKPAFSHPYYWAGYQLMGNSSAVYIAPRIYITGLGGFIFVIALILWRKKKMHTEA